MVAAAVGKNGRYPGTPGPAGVGAPSVSAQQGVVRPTSLARRPTVAANTEAGWSHRTWRTTAPSASTRPAAWPRWPGRRGRRAPRPQVQKRAALPF